MSRIPTVLLAQAKVDGDSVDAFKGLFIVFIVLGHVTLLSAAGPDFGRTLYAFHVYAFFFLPFLYPAKDFSLRDTADKAVRYLIPYFYFTTASAMLFFLMYRRNDFVLDFLREFFVALFVASSALLDVVTGFQLYWFLPALFFMFLLRSVLSRMPWSFGVVSFGALFFFHPVVGELSSEVKRYFPFGGLIALYLLPLGGLSVWILRACSARLFALGCGFGIIFLGLVVVMWHEGSMVNLAKLELYGYKNIYLMLLHDAIAVCGFVFFLIFSVWYKRFVFLQRLGKCSLVVYLTHSLIYQALLMASGRLGVVPVSVEGKLLFGLFLAVFTLIASYVLSRYFFLKDPVSRIVFPRSLNDLCEWSARRVASQ